MRLRVAAYALIERDGGTILVRVNEPDIPAHGKWTLPGGGIDPGEDPRDAAKREVFEETGLEVVIQDLVEVDSEVLEYQGELLQTIRIVYRAAVLGGDIRAEIDGTTDECRLFSEEELAPLDCVTLAERFAQRRRS